MKNGEIIDNIDLGHGYFKVRFHVPELCRTAQGGQFVHVLITALRNRILRRPFSINTVDDAGALTVIYKVVGSGTEVLSAMRPGEVCDVMGPLGKPFTLPAADEIPILVGGGYGSAAMQLVAERSAQKGVLLLGARSSDDILLVDEYQRHGFDVRIATDDGSLGHKGRVTELLDGVFADFAGGKLRFYGCGPMPMLMAMGTLLKARAYPVELSVDECMCCGVGACFACVVRLRDETSESGFRYARSCNEGPVFPLEQIYFD